MMWNRGFVGVLLATALSIAAACADTPHDGKRPVFTVQDNTIIERNADLRGLVDRDPWLVRRVLDAIAAVEPPVGPSGGPLGRSTIMQEQTPAPSRNPDLNHLERSSPEAAHDLFQLIKKASGNRKDQQQR